jgi:hypothetical protein
MLSSIDEQFISAGGTFTAVASNNKLFLQHGNALSIERCSLNAIVELLVAAQDAIDTFSACCSQNGLEWLIAQGLDSGLAIDHVFIANYEHMLLRLRVDLIEALERKALEELLGGGHDKKQRKLLSWFTEFAEKPRPLSTSFPWTIKPSLAVLWGVCWMFYDHAANEGAAKGGNDRIRPARVLQHLQWNAPASSDCKFRMLCFRSQRGFRAKFGRCKPRPRADWHTAAAATRSAAADCEQHKCRPCKQSVPRAKHGNLGVRFEPSRF